MIRILQSIEHCEQHVRNQADYIQNIDSALKREGDASVIHARQLNSMVVSIADHGRAIQTLSNSVLDQLTLTRSTNTAFVDQAKQLTNLQALVTSFRDQVFSIPEREEPQAEEGEPSPVVEETHTQTPSFFRRRGQPQTPHHRTQKEESRASSPSLSELEEWPSVRRRSAREATAWPPAPQAGVPDTTRGEGRVPPLPPAVNIPKEVRVKKPEPFSGKKG
jgi:hypothetical protein